MIDPTLQTVMLGTGAIGAVAGLIGSFAVVRRRSLQGDAISHAALPGVAIAFLLGGVSSESIALGAGIAGWLALLTVNAVLRRSRLTHDAVLGGALAVFFGLGLALMEYIKRHVRGSTQHGLERYLFGQAATMRQDDVTTIALVGLAVAVILVLFWKQLFCVAFDADYAHSLGFPVHVVDAILAALLVAAVVIGLQAVGVVLMSALIVAPAVTARQCTHRLSTLVILAAFFGAVAGVTGSLLSHLLTEHGRTIPTGPIIVLCATVMAVLALLWRAGGVSPRTPEPAGIRGPTPPAHVEKS